MLSSLWLTLGADRIKASSDAESRDEDSAWDPSSERPPSQPAKTREESACLSFAPPVVHMTQFGITHTYTRIHTERQTYSFSSTQGGFVISAACTRTNLACSPTLSALCASCSARPSSVSALLSVSPAVLWGFRDGGGGFQMFLCWFYQSAPSLFIVSTLWQTNTLTCPGS